MNYKPEPVVIAGLECYNEQEILKYVREHFETLLKDTGIDAEIVDMKVIGSRVAGNHDADSDLDVLLEFKGNASEDSLFNILNDDDEENGRLYIEGIPVDINPITKGKSGTIQEFLERNADYRKETDKNNKIDDTMEETVKNENVKVSLDVVGMNDESIHSVVVRGSNVKVALAEGISKVTLEEIDRMAVSFGGEVRHDGDGHSIVMSNLGSAELFARRLKYWDAVRNDNSYDAMSIDFGIRNMCYTAAAAYGITRVLPDMQHNRLADDIFRIWNGDRSVLNGLSVKDYFIEVFRQLNNIDAPLHTETRQQWDVLSKYSGNHLREAVWMLAHSLDDILIERVLGNSQREVLEREKDSTDIKVPYGNKSYDCRQIVLPTSGDFLLCR